MARAWNVTDGFDGMLVLPNNPLTGAPITAPVVMRYQPSANLGAINLYGINLQKKVADFDLFLSGNWASTRPVLTWSKSTRQRPVMAPETPVSRSDSTPAGIFTFPDSK
jgi:hypothetical protein